MVTPDYYDKFKCIGGKCKHNCCEGAWEIEVDDEALDRFAKIGGEFGARVMESVDDNGVFIRKNGRCPLLSPDGWCEMVRNGHELCIICDEYPRFTEYYDDYVERGISISCEASAEIVLGNKEKVSLCGESGKCSDDLFKLLYSARNDIFDILQNRDIDIFKRMSLALNYGESLQEKINENDFSDFSYTPQDRAGSGGDTSVLFEFLSELTTLSDDWADKLKVAKMPEEIDRIKTEQLCVYFVYRYFLKAFYDCDALSKLKLMAISVIAVLSLSDVCGSIFESARLYSVEVEHNEDNIDAIYDEFLFNDGLSTEKIISMIK